MRRTYSELARLTSFEERFRYLALRGTVGRDTFGFDRHMNQKFYASREWRMARRDVIARDLGCDLAHEDHPIHGPILIHHMNPMVVEDILHGNDDILNIEYLISTTHRTHNAIHYGDESLLPRKLVERTRGDTKLW